MSTFGLVIQGPLVSYGRKSGRTAHIGWRHILEKDWVQYDCRENIRTIIKDFGYLFEHIVISTWKNEIQSDDSWDRATLIASDDEMLPKKYRKDQEGRAVPDNRFRQMYSTLVGVEYLETHSNVDMVVKMRTDQYIDLGKVLECIRRSQDLRQYTNDVIFIPSIMREDPRYAILDFYFAGSLQAMKAFPRSFFEYGGFEFNPSIHHELWLKYAYVFYRDRIGVPEYAYFPSSYGKVYCRETLDAFRWMVRRVFWLLSFDCFQTLIWRGEPFGKEVLEFERRNNIFQETVSENRIEEIFRFLSGGCPRFLGIDWFRYADFRRRALQKPLSFKEQIFLYQNIGTVLVVWFLKRIGYYVTHPVAFFAGAKRRFFRLLRKPL